MEKNTNTKSSSREKHFSLSTIIYNDKYLLVLSLILAVLVWIASSISVGATETRNVRCSVPIKLGDSVSKQLSVDYFSLQDTVDINVSIDGPKYVVGQVTQDDLNITFDTSSVNRTGIQTVPIRVTNKSKTKEFEVKSFYPNSIECYFDVNQSKTLDIQVEYDKSNIADGYVIGTPVLSENKIVISGPKTYVDKIRGAYVEVEFGTDTNLTEPQTQDCKILFKGDGVDTSYLTISTKEENPKVIETVSATLPILKEMTLPITSTFEGKPSGVPTGAVSVRYSTNKITVGVLQSANISTVDIGTISFNALSTGRTEFEFRPNTIDGITVLDDNTVVKATVTVNSNYVKQRIKINTSKVTVEGAKVGSTSRVKSLDNYFVTVIAPRGTYISSNDLVVKCNISEKSKDNTYPLDISVSNNSCWVYGTYNAVVE